MKIAPTAALTNARNWTCIVNLLAEHEATKMLQLLQAVCAYHKLPEAQDPELADLLRRTEPAMLARELDRQLPLNGSAASDGGVKGEK